MTAIQSQQIYFLLLLLNGTNYGCHGNLQGTWSELPNLFSFLCK